VHFGLIPLIVLVLFAVKLPAAQNVFKSDPLSWPPLTKDNMPGTRWWWMGNAVTPPNLIDELETFHKAGLGTVEITPTYGVKGYETQFIEYLNPKWMEMLRVAVSEAQKLDMSVDMTTGTGWNFGGPDVGDKDANASVICKNGEISQKPSGQKVKRPAPGGEGWMLNLLYPDSVSRYLEKFNDAFSRYTGPNLHAQFHDSYEYRSNWSPDFLAQFEKRRGYRLQDEIPAFFEGKGDVDHLARVKCDYRETASELIEESITRWTKWSHDQGSLSREQAHGSPGNWLDIYAASDIPETEMFYKDRDVLASKFASSATHVTGRNLTSSETGTWVAEHFTETLADMKYLFDDMYLSGVNRIMYHGTAYSPADAQWPGWCFYASAEMNPRNSIWHDVPALNCYAARVQSMLQSGRSDNDILLYWPIYDKWHDAKGMLQQFNIHAEDWFNSQPIGKTALMLWERGYAFDYISDKQLQQAKVVSGFLDLFGNKYKAVVVPTCDLMPVETLKKLISFSDEGVAVIFENKVPHDVPGFGDLGRRRAEFSKLTPRSTLIRPTELLDAALSSAGIRPEEITRQVGVHFVRRASEDGGSIYFIANRGNLTFDQFITLGRPAVQTAILDPMSGRTGMAEILKDSNWGTRVHLQLEPGESLILRTFYVNKANIAQSWNYWRTDGKCFVLNGKWDIKFIVGGPSLPNEYTTDKLSSWTENGDGATQSFGGTAIYTLRFDAPELTVNTPIHHWSLDLGKVCQSARVRLNGKNLGTVFIPPFRVPVNRLKLKDNVLEVEITSTSANRIRDLDRRGIQWKIFYDSNILSLNYKPFDASKWPVAEAGLLGPVTLRAESADK